MNHAITERGICVYVCVCVIMNLGVLEKRAYAQKRALKKGNCTGMSESIKDVFGYKFLDQ